MTATRGEASGLEIAIVGMSCHFPGAPSVEAFLENLRAGVESIRFFDDEELRGAGIPPALLSHPAYVKAAAALEGIEAFDAGYFGYTPRDAELIDPQQRLFLERAAEALERAGHDPERFPGAIGVYAGLTAGGYAARLLGHPQLRGLVDGFEVLVANDRDFLATRVAYKLNLQGPAVVVQTACSTSLAAVHVACQALLAGDCDMALAGGVSVRVPHQAGYLYQEEGIASPDGHCRPFDARANGTVPGSGVGVVVLRRLADALADGDIVEAVIRGSAINNDGANRLGFTAPRVEGQAQVIRSALAAAEVEASSIGYVEAHGTATALGDPIEISALNQAFGPMAGRRCALGSVKGNFGHLDASAGVAGLVKAVLSLKHRQVFPSLHFEQPNPRADLAGGPFYVNTALADWPRGGGPRRAGVSSFGMGGTNVHVVLEEAPERAPGTPSAGPQLLVLSARTDSALTRSQADLAAHLRAHPEADLADVALTLTSGRRQLERRLALVARGTQEAARALEGGEPVHLHRGRASGTSAPVAFVFTGQGAQRAGMTQGLYASEPAFRRELDGCLERVGGALEGRLREALLPPVEGRAVADEALRSTALAQPALFAIEYALARLWMAWGVRPQALIGHSIGEYVAACLAGVFDLEDALALVAERGRLMASCAPGAMLAVMQSAERLTLGEDASVAAINAPEACVITGSEGAIEAWQQRLEAEGVACVRLHTAHAFHSADMEPIQEPFREHVARTPRRPPVLPFVSNVTGTWIGAGEAVDPAYWARQLRAPVQFAKGVGELLREPGRVLLEVGPGDGLASLARRQLPPREGGRVVASLKGRPPAEDEPRALLDAAARLWVAGVGLDPAARLAGAGRRRLLLPTYPFERQRYWIDPPARTPLPPGPGVRREDVADWFYVPSWRRVPPPAAAGEGGPLCIFAGRGGMGAALAAPLRAAGADVVLVEAARSFERHGLDYGIDPKEPGHYRRVLEELVQRGRTPRRVVHAWGVDSEGDDLERGLWSVLALTQAMGALEQTTARLLVVTTGVHDVTGRELLRPARATVLGLCRVVPMEYPGLACRSIDVELAGPGLDADAVSRLREELLADAAEPVIALRGAYRWAPAFEPIRPAPDRGPRLRDRGVYLITGGLGGIGLALAEDLALAQKARLVLVSRSAARTRAVERLESSGAEVLVARADVADREQMARVVAEAEQRFGAIHGVVHAAGVPGAGLIQLKTREQALAVLAPKVAGTLVLRDLFHDRALDFMLLCSSLTGVLGAVGQADYAAANAFLDAFAQDASRTWPGPLVVSVAWDTWKDAGMAVEVELPSDLRGRRPEMLSHGLGSHEGVDVFHRALAAGLPRVLVSTRALDERWAGRRSPASAAASADLEPRTGARHARPPLQTELVPPRTDLERALAEAWQLVLGIDGIGVTDNFFELGGESLSALRLVGFLKETRGLSISLVRLYEAPTIERLARHVDGASDTSVEAGTKRGEARAEAMARQQRARRG